MNRKAILDEQHIKQLEYLLGEIPMKYAMPILQLIEMVIKTDTNDNTSKTDTGNTEH